METWIEAAVTAARSGRLGVLTDVDGTISPLAEHPGEARVEPRAIAALAALAPRITIAGAVSGRDLDDLRRMVGLDALYYSGGHGLSWRFGELSGHAEGAEVFAAEVEPAASDLAGRLAGQPVRFERKRFGLAIHYRDAADAAAARAGVMAAVAASAAARRFAVREGARVVELVPPLTHSADRFLSEVLSSTAILGGGS